MGAKHFLVLVFTISCFRWSNGDNKNSNYLKDCSGTIGFSSAEVSKVHSTGILQYKKNIFDSGHGWNRDTGTYTVVCAGLYSVSFSAYGAANSKFTLKKRSASSNSYTPIISTPPGGGASSVIVRLEIAEQLLLTIEGGLRTGLESTTPVNVFTMYRIAEK